MRPRGSGLSPAEAVAKAREQAAARPGSVGLLSVKSRNIYLLWVRTLGSGP